VQVATERGDTAAIAAASIAFTNTLVVATVAVDPTAGRPASPSPQVVPPTGAKADTAAADDSVVGPGAKADTAAADDSVVGPAAGGAVAALLVLGVVGYLMKCHTKKAGGSGKTVAARAVPNAGRSPQSAAGGLASNPIGRKKPMELFAVQC